MFFTSERKIFHPSQYFWHRWTPCFPSLQISPMFFRLLSEWDRHFGCIFAAIHFPGKSQFRIPVIKEWRLFCALGISSNSPWNHQVDVLFDSVIPSALSFWTPKGSVDENVDQNQKLNHISGDRMKQQWFTQAPLDPTSIMDMDHISSRFLLITSTKVNCSIAKLHIWWWLPDSRNGIDWK
jgi:hypothetical protein